MRGAGPRGRVWRRGRPRGAARSPAGKAKRPLQAARGAGVAMVAAAQGRPEGASVGGQGRSGGPLSVLPPSPRP